MQSHLFIQLVIFKQLLCGLIDSAEISNRQTFMLKVGQVRYTLVPEEQLINNFACNKINWSTVDHGNIIYKSNETLYLTQVTGFHLHS